MSYIIIAYREKKKLGKFRDDNGKIVYFRTRKEAVTAAGIEGTQMESEGVDFKIKKVKRK